MRILICDDEERHLKDLKVHIEEYMRSHNIISEFFTTSVPNEILNSNKAFDLAFLDIQMPQINGITLAKELKSRNGKVILFFVTNFEEYQDEAMDLHIFRFFEKPFDVQRLYSSLDKAMEYIDESYVDIFLYNNGEHKRILVDDIVFIRRDNRKIILTTTDKNEYITKESLDKWSEKLPNTFFYLVHKGFLINLHYVTKYSYTELYLDDIRIPIATRKQAGFHKYWFRYLRRR